MHQTITKAIADGLRPAAKPYEVFDTRDVGLIFRVQPTGVRAWYFAYRLAGRRGRFRIGNFPGVSVEGARKIVKVLAGKVAHGVDPQLERQAERHQAERDKVSTLRAFLDVKYEPWAKSNLKTADAQLKRIRSDFQKWLDKPIGKITAEMAEEWRTSQVMGGKKPVTANRDLQRLHAALTKAVEWKILVGPHPLEDLKPLKTDRKGRVRYLSAEEDAALRKALLDREESLRKARDRFNDWRRARHLAELPARTGAFIDHVRPMVLLALDTGLRRGELLSLRWRQIDAASKWLTVEGTSAKTGQTRHIPLNAEARALVNSWRAHSQHTTTNDLVFCVARGRKMTRIDRAWGAVMKLAGIQNFRFHDCRHDFASKLVMRGKPLNTVRELLGHTSLEMTLRYAHLAPDNLAAAVEKLAA